MPASLVSFEPRTLVFDTGPLWELVLYAAVHEFKFEFLKTELTHLRDEYSYKNLTEFIALFHKKTTTPHVVAEISSKIIRTERSGQPTIWEVVYTQFSELKMDESLLKLLEMPQYLVGEIGAVDVSVLKLGSSFGRPNSLVISTDNKLVTECKRAGVDAQDLWEVISG